MSYGLKKFPVPSIPGFLFLHVAEREKPDSPLVTPGNTVYNMARQPQSCPEGMREIFCRFVVRNGKRIYPKRAKFFRFFVAL